MAKKTSTTEEEAPKEETPKAAKLSDPGSSVEVRSFTFPEYGIVVKAHSASEARRKLQSILASKQPSND